MWKCLLVCLCGQMVQYAHVHVHVHTHVHALKLFPTNGGRDLRSPASLVNAS